MNRKTIVRSLLMLVFITTVCVLGVYLTQTKEVEVVFSNIKEVSVINKKDNQLVSSFKNSGQKVRIYKNDSYELRFTGIDGYATDKIEFDTSKNSIKIEPFYSKLKLSELLTEDLFTDLKSEINTHYPGVESLYSVAQGELYHYGEWYGTTLIYKGEYEQNSDALKIVLKKNKDNTWSIATTPSITLSHVTYGTIPRDVLKSVNYLN